MIFGKWTEGDYTYKMYSCHVKSFDSLIVTNTDWVDVYNNSKVINKVITEKKQENR